MFNLTTVHRQLHPELLTSNNTLILRTVRKKPLILPLPGKLTPLSAWKMAQPRWLMPLENFERRFWGLVRTLWMNTDYDHLQKPFWKPSRPPPPLPHTRTLPLPSLHQTSCLFIRHRTIPLSLRSPYLKGSMETKESKQSSSPPNLDCAPFPTHTWFPKTIDTLSLHFWTSLGR